MTGNPRRDPRFDLVIFDLDGTLVDTAPDIARALGATFAAAGLPVPGPDRVRGMIGDGARKLIERALPPSEAGREPAPLVAGFVAHYGARVCEDSRLYPGVVPMLDALGAAGTALAVVTNKPGLLARQLLAALGIADRFAAVIGDGDGFPRKPDPAAARSILAKEGTTPARTAVVGDGLQDITMARALGSAAVAVTWGYVAPDALRAAGPEFLAGAPDEAAGWLRSEG